MQKLVANVGGHDFSEAPRWHERNWSRSRRPSLGWMSASPGTDECFAAIHSRAGLLPPSSSCLLATASRCHRKQERQKAVSRKPQGRKHAVARQNRRSAVVGVLGLPSCTVEERPAILASVREPPKRLASQTSDTLDDPHAYVRHLSKRYAGLQRCPAGDRRATSAARRNVGWHR